MPDGLDYDKGDLALHSNMRLCNQDVRIELRYKSADDSWFVTVYQAISGTIRETQPRWIRPELQKLVDSFFTVGETLSENRAFSPRV